MERVPNFAKQDQKRQPAFELRDGRLPSSPNYLLRTVSIWPDFPSQQIADYVDRNLQAIDEYKKEEPEENPGPILSSQFRAVDYLYGRREEAIKNDPEVNPLVDILTLIVQPSSHDLDPQNFSLGIQGKPFARPIMGSRPKSLMVEQRTLVGETPHEIEYRTVARFGKHLGTVIRGLSVLNECSKFHPQVLRSALKQYVERITEKQGTVAGVSMGLLEILYNTNLIHDRRFHPLSSQLGNIVIDKTGDYKTIKARYFYRVVDERPFWYSREAEVVRRKGRLSYIEDGAGKIEVGGAYKLAFPSFPNWQLGVKQRTDLAEGARLLTHFHSLARSANNFSQENALRSLNEDQIKKADITLQKRLLERKLIDRLRGKWLTFMKSESEEDGARTESEVNLIRAATTVILKYFLPDHTLSQKSRTNIAKSIGNEEGTYYELKAEKFIGNPLFSWILSLRDEYFANGFRNSALKTSESVESFYLLLKLMAFEVARSSFQVKEDEFLFDPNYKQRFDRDSLTKLFEEITALTVRFVPDARDLAKEALIKGDAGIKDILSSEFLNKARRNLESLLYKRFLKVIDLDKSVAFTPEDRKILRKIVSGISTAGLVAATIFGSFELLKRVIAPYAISRRQAASAAAVTLEAERLGLQRSLGRYGELASLAMNDFTQELRTRMGLESKIPASVSQAGIPPSVVDNIPDAIDRAQLEGIGIAIYGRIYHLPEQLKGYEGEAVGYFPWDRALKIDSYVQEGGLRWWTGATPLDNVVSVGSIDNYQQRFEENQLAYSLNSVNPRIYPPLGWKIVRVVQEGGKTPWVGPLGEIYYDYDGTENLPARVLLILEPFESQEISPRILTYSDVRLNQYGAFPSEPWGMYLNGFLEGDPILQELHADYIHDMVEARKAVDAIEQESRVATKYANLFAEYTNTYRYYALGFQINSQNREIPSLEAIAEEPQEGYFCSVAANAFRDFMASGGIAVVNQPGISLYNYQGYLWGKLPHQNNLILLPNGRVLSVDMTPYATERSPVEDLRALAGGALSVEDMSREIAAARAQEEPQESVVNTTQETGVSENEVRRLARMEEEVLTQAAQQEALNEIADDSQTLIAARLRLMPEVMNSIETARQGDERAALYEELRLLKVIMLTSQGLSRRNISMSTILSNWVPGQELLSYYESLEEIRDSAEELKILVSNEEEFQLLDEIVSNANRVRKSIERIANGRLVEARRDRFLRDTIRGDIERMWPYLSEQVERKRIAEQWDLVEQKRIQVLLDRHEQEVRRKQLLDNESNERRNLLESRREAERVAQQLRNEALMESLSDASLKLGVGLVPLATAYFGITHMNKRRQRKGALERIERSLSLSKDFSSGEKDIVASAIGHLSILPYGNLFPEKAVSILNLIQRYSRDSHSEAIGWLGNEGVMLLAQDSPDKAFAELRKIVKDGKEPEVQEVMRYFPPSVTERLQSPETSETPYDFLIAYGLASLIFQNRINLLAKDVYSRIGVRDLLEEISLKYKAQDVLRLLHQKYAAKDTPDEVKPILNAIYSALDFSVEG